MCSCRPTGPRRRSTADGGWVDEGRGGGSGDARLLRRGLRRAGGGAPRLTRRWSGWRPGSRSGWSPRAAAAAAPGARALDGPQAVKKPGAARPRSTARAFGAERRGVRRSGLRRRGPGSPSRRGAGSRRAGAGGRRRARRGRRSGSGRSRRGRRGRRARRRGGGRWRGGGSGRAARRRGRRSARASTPIAPWAIAGSISSGSIGDARHVEAEAVEAGHRQEGRGGDAVARACEAGLDVAAELDDARGPGGGGGAGRRGGGSRCRRRCRAAASRGSAGRG